MGYSAIARAFNAERVWDGLAFLFAFLFLKAIAQECLRVGLLREFTLEIAVLLVATFVFRRVSHLYKWELCDLQLQVFRLCEHPSLVRSSYWYVNCDCRFQSPHLLAHDLRF